MIKLSFIIPAYNASATIIACLDSIYSLPLEESNFEVVCVDDCSSDDTVAIIRKYAQSYSNLVLLCQKENHRQGAARNRGLEVAKGKYIMFVDSDDVVLHNLLEVIQQTNSNIDMIYSFMEIEQPDKIYTNAIEEYSTNIMSGLEFGDKYCADGVFYYPPSYLYRNEFLQSIHLPFIEDRQHEDRDWLANVLTKAQTVAIAPYLTYRYTFNPNSTCRLPRYSTVFDHVASGIRHIDLSKQLTEKCPKLSATLYTFGVDEIYKSIRLRNLTKYTWRDNKHLYDSKHLAPLMSDLKRVCKEIKLPVDGAITIYHPIITGILVFFASPIAKFIRTIKHK